MSSRGDNLNLAFAAIAGCILFAFDAVDERDRRVAAEERLQQIERAADRPCTAKPGHRLVSTIDADSDGDLVRWCGYFQTSIETVRILWEQAQ